MIGTNVIGYAIMHLFVWGFPHFTLRTEQGVSEIGYTTCTLVLIGMGAGAVYRGTKCRRGQE
jgi:hypothetical protein